MKNCIFCKIVKGEIPCIKIWEDENYLSFLDVNPLTPGHSLLIPKKHTDYIFDLEDGEYCDLMKNTKKVAQLLKFKLNPKRVGMIVEGLEVPHVHVHLIPINKMSDMNPLNAKPATAEERQEIATKIFE